MAISKVRFELGAMFYKTKDPTKRSDLEVSHNLTLTNVQFILVAVKVKSTKDLVTLDTRE